MLCVNYYLFLLFVCASESSWARLNTSQSFGLICLSLSYELKSKLIDHSDFSLFSTPLQIFFAFFFFESLIHSG